MNEEEVLDVEFSPNYTDRKTPNRAIYICRSLDNPKELLFQFDYDGREDDFVFMNVDIMELMLALGKVFGRSD